MSFEAKLQPGLDLVEKAKCPRGITAIRSAGMGSYFSFLRELWCNKALRETKIKLA
jgi:hypothetical protein